MKQFIVAALMMSTITLFANNTNPKVSETKTVNTETSTIVWTGKKVTGQHTGTIAIKSGELNFENDKLIGGNFVIDMNTIACTDLDGEYGKKLEGHLKSDDFFGVQNHPTSKLKITSVAPASANSGYMVTADLTIKGITKPITFQAEVGQNMAKAKVIIDRTQFDVRYGSGSFFDGLGDKMIYDDFELNLSLKF